MSREEGKRERFKPAPPVPGIYLGQKIEYNGRRFPVLRLSYNSADGRTVRATVSLNKYSIREAAQRVTARMHADGVNTEANVDAVAGYIDTIARERGVRLT